MAQTWQWLRWSLNGKETLINSIFNFQITLLEFFIIVVLIIFVQISNTFQTLIQFVRKRYVASNKPRTQDSSSTLGKLLIRVKYEVQNIHDGVVLVGFLYRKQQQRNISYLHTFWWIIDQVRIHFIIFLNNSQQITPKKWMSLGCLASLSCLQCFLIKFTRLFQSWRHHFVNIYVKQS